MPVIEIEFPLPLATDFGANSRGIWASKNRFVQEAKHEGWVLGKEAIQKARAVPAEAYFLVADFYVSRGDNDNLLGRIKYQLDGIATALGINDSKFNPILVERHQCARRRGRVVLRFEEAA